MLTRPLTWLDAAPESWPGSCGCALGVCALQRPRSPQGCPRDHSRGSAFPPFCLAFRVGSTRTAPGLVWFPSPLFLHSLPGPLPHTPATAQASGAGQQERETENAGGPATFGPTALPLRKDVSPQSSQHLPAPTIATPCTHCRVAWGPKSSRQ